MIHDTADIIEIHRRYTEYNVDNMAIVFYNCDANLLKFFRHSGFLTSYIIHNDMVIVFKYDINTFPKVEMFYYFIINSAENSKVNSYCYTFTDSSAGTETYHVIRNGKFMELIIFYDDLAVDMGIDSIEFNINGVYINPINFPLNSIEHIGVIYKYMVNFIDDIEFNELLNSIVL